MRAARSLKCALMAVSLVVLGCGGGSGRPPPGCAQVRPCGGDLIGTWDFVGACVADTSPLTFRAEASCRGTAVSNVGYATSGTITFNADLTYVAQGWNTMFTQTYAEPESCRAGTTCADRSLTVTSSDGSFSNLTCAGTTDCTCRQSTLSAVSESGTYTTTGTDFYLVGPTTSRNRSYCVEGSLLHLVEVGPTSTDPAATTVIVADAVASRR